MAKIKRLVIRNWLGIQELALTAGQVNIISGGNERGKTSILEALEKLLYNTQRRARLVRIGADEAVLELDTDDGMHIERTIPAEGDPSVKVTRGQFVVKSPESYLKEMFGVSAGKRKADVFAFNPVDFMSKKDTEQTDILLGLMPISVSKHDAQQWFGMVPATVDYTRHGLQVIKDLEKFFYEARHEAGCRKRATEAQVEALRKQLPDNYQVAEWEKVSLGELYDRVRAAEAINTSIIRAREFLDGTERMEAAINDRYDLKEKELAEIRDLRLEKAQAEINRRAADIAVEIQSIEEQIRKLEMRKAALETERKNILEMGLAGKKEALDRELEAQLEGVRESRTRELEQLAAKVQEAENYLAQHKPVDVDPLKFQAQHAEEMKAYIPLARELKQLENRLVEEEGIWRKYDQFVELCRSKPAELLAQVKPPIEGLGIDDDGLVTVNGLPLRNLSTSQQVRVCLEIARALAKDWPLKLICVDRLESLDATIRNEFLRQIEEDDSYQYWVTQVTEGELKIETRGIA